MNTSYRLAVLVKTFFFTSLIILNTSCGGDANNASVSTAVNATAPVKTRNLVSHMFTADSTGPLKGNGIWNYSVATDFYYGSMNPPMSPSLAVDLKNNPDANIEYVFATFISLSTGVGSNPALINEACPTEADGAVPIIAYYALPMLNPKIYQGASLGGCVAGVAATAYYAGINKSAPLKVIPIAEYADDSFPAKLAADTTGTTIREIAAALANKIVADPNTYGLGIDNEKSISSSYSESSKAQLAQNNEILFFGELARILAAGNKFLFLFDAPETAKTLYATYKNVVILSPLYDLDDSTAPNGFNPDQLTQYTSSLKQANGTLTVGTASGQSVMFVVPASATSTIWDYEMAYNISFATTANPYITPILNAPSITANINGANCNTAAPDNLTMTVLTGPTGLIGNSSDVSNFLSPTNCYYFKNPTSLNSYFSASLNAITAAKKQTNISANYVGAVMYAWRISGMNSINAAKNFSPSIYTQDGVPTKVVYLTGPPDIQTSSWDIFNNWAPSDK